MKKGFLVLLMLSVALNASSLDVSIAQATSIKVLDLIFLGAKVVGAIVVILGLVELLVEFQPIIFIKSSNIHLCLNLLA